MKTFLRMLRMEFLPFNVDLGLLVLRLWLGLSLLLLHGSTKLTGFQEMSENFPSFFGLGRTVSLGLAVFGEVVGAALVAIGLFTRFGAVMSGATMAVAFFMAHKMALKGPASGELAFIYLAGFVTIFIAGGGRFSIDGSKRTSTSRREA